MRAAGADGLSIDAGKTLVVDGDAVIRAADAAGIVVVGRAVHAGGRTIRLAVIGVGHLGRHHARIAAHGARRRRWSPPSISSPSGRRRRSEGTSARALTDARELLSGGDAVDAVVVAVPTADHLAVARPFLERGIHVLVEKPMAASIDEADGMIARLAEASGAVLAVGHTERFNPGGPGGAADAARRRDSSRCIGSAGSRNEASTSTSSST